MKIALILPAIAVFAQRSPTAAAPGSPDRSQAATETIRVTGTINACYNPESFMVFVTSVPRGRFESASEPVDSMGRFSVTLDKAQATPGDYVLNFGKTKNGAGGRRFTVTSATVTVNLGVLGECDV